MEGKLAKNSFPTSVDFKFNINSTRNPVLKDLWTRSIRKCKTDMTLALLDDLQKTYNTKAPIAKDMADLEKLLNNYRKSKNPSTRDSSRWPPPLWRENSSSTGRERVNPEGRTWSPDEEANPGVHRMTPK